MCASVSLSSRQVISVEPPNFVELLITDTPPGVKGNTASGARRRFACARRVAACTAQFNSDATAAVPYTLPESRRVRPRWHMPCLRTACPTVWLQAAAARLLCWRRARASKCLCSLSRESSSRSIRARTRTSTAPRSEEAVPGVVLQGAGSEGASGRGCGVLVGNARGSQRVAGLLHACDGLLGWPALCLSSGRLRF